MTGLALQVQAVEPDAWLEVSDIRFANDVPLSTLADAVDWAAEQADLKSYQVVFLPKPKTLPDLVLEALGYQTDDIEIHSSTSGLFYTKIFKAMGFPLSAEEAYRIGLAQWLTPHDALMDKTMEVAQHIANLPPPGCTHDQGVAKSWPGYAQHGRCVAGRSLPLYGARVN